jgi:hypothetical protein
MTPSNQTTFEDELEHLRGELASITIQIKDLAGMSILLEDLRALIHLVEQHEDKFN